MNGARAGFDAGHGIDQKVDSLRQKFAVVAGRMVVADRELVQPGSLDEMRPGIDDGDRSLPAHAVGGDRSGVSTADDDDTGACVQHGFSPIRSLAPSGALVI